MQGCTSRSCSFFPSQKNPWRASPTKICQLELPSLVDEQVLGFEVSVEDFPAVAISQATEQLEHEDLQDGGGGGRGWIFKKSTLDVVGRKDPWELCHKRG